MSTREIRVAITHGDINGIGYEVVLKIFEDERILELFTPILYGSSHVASFWKAHLGLEHVSWQVIRQASEAKDGVLNILDCTTGREQVEIGQPTDAAGRVAFEALERATADIRMGLCDVLVTAPINKAVMPRDLFPFNGHTDYLEAIAARTPGESLMVLASGDCRVALATTHIPVSAIASRLSSELILRKLRLLEAGLQRDFGITKPRLAVLGLNPHAGDKGLMGNEEETIIRPAIEEAFTSGIITFGPFPGDGFWGSGRVDSFDGILAMYHDQGLAPFKALYMNEGVNVTLGQATISLVRVSLTPPLCERLSTAHSTSTVTVVATTRLRAILSAVTTTIVGETTKSSTRPVPQTNTNASPPSSCPSRYIPPRRDRGRRTPSHVSSCV